MPLYVYTHRFHSLNAFVHSFVQFVFRSFHHSLHSFFHSCIAFISVTFNFIKITDAGVVAVAVHLPHLSHLNLTGCTQVSDTSITAIAAQCPRLTRLDLRFLHRVTGAGANMELQFTCTV